MFLEQFRKPLAFQEHVKDQKRPDDEVGYVSLNFGDSGNAFWSTKNDNGVQRSTLVGIFVLGRHRPIEDESTYIKDASYTCRFAATKITEDIWLWLTEKAGIKRNQ